MKKFISIILTFALILGCIPVNAFAAEPSVSGDYIEIISDTAILRTGPGKNYSEVDSLDLQPGDCLALTNKAYTINKHGNVWFEIVYNDTVVYLYEQHASFHEHNYVRVDEGFTVCKCGSYKIEESSPIMQTDAAAATAGTLLTAEAIAALSELSAAGGTIGSGLAAFPYVAVVAVSGVLIYMMVSRSGSQVKQVTKVRTAVDVMEMLGKVDDPNIYFAAAFTFGKKPTLLLVSKGMDLTDATDYMTKIVDSSANAFVSALARKPMLNMWTPLRDNAALLCQNFMEQNAGFTYGDSNKTIGAAEHDQTYKNYKIYFEHFHLFRVSNPFSLTKVRDIHILFGSPLDLKPTV